MNSASHVVQKTWKLYPIPATFALTIFGCNVYTYPDSKLCRENKTYYGGAGKRTLPIWLTAGAKGLIYAGPLIPFTFAFGLISTMQARENSFRWLFYLGEGYI